MKQIFLVILLTFELLASVVKSPLQSVDVEKNSGTIQIDKVDIGVSGFVVHKIDENHHSILKNAVVTAYDNESKIATLQLSDFDAFRNNSLPTGKWSVQVGDSVELAFGYSRALLIAPSEEIYHQITKSVNVQWIHPDIFATILSYRGHPTPLQEDFQAMGVASSVGLVFIYLDKKVYTVDMKSFTILNISEAPLTQDSVKLPFYSRIESIEANWFGEGSDELEDYEIHYYDLLAKNNSKNKALYEIVKNGDKKLQDLLENFEIGK